MSGVTSSDTLKKTGSTVKTSDVSALSKSKSSLDTDISALKKTTEEQLTRGTLDDWDIGMGPKPDTEEARVYQLGRRYLDIHQVEIETESVTTLTPEAIPLFRDIASEAMSELLETVPVSNTLNTRLEAMAFLHRYGLLHRSDESSGRYGDKTAPVDDGTPSPYTFNSLLNFSALAESVIKMADSYNGFDNNDVIQKRGLEIQTFLRCIVSAASSDHLQNLVDSPGSLSGVSPEKGDKKTQAAIEGLVETIYDALGGSREHFIDTVKTSLAELIKLLKKDLPSAGWNDAAGRLADTLYQNLMSGTVQHFLNSLPGSIPQSLLPTLLMARSFKEFNQLADKALAKMTLKELDAYPWPSHVERRYEALLEKTGQSGADLSVKNDIKMEAFRQDVKRRLWGVVQLWHLESARRRAAGVMNTVNARMGAITMNSLGGDDTAGRKAVVSGIIVTQNVLSGSGASGKSQNPSTAKFERLQKAAEILTRMLSGDFNDKPLGDLKKHVLAFMKKMETDPNFAKAQKAWLAAAGLDDDSFDSGDRMALHVSKALKKNGDVNALMGGEAWKGLQDAFGKFMQNQYADPAISSDSVPSGIHDSDDEVEISPFMMWLINKASSGAHQAVLSQVVKEETAVLTGFVDNRDPETATMVRHIALLRHAYHTIGQAEFHPLQSLKIHSHNPSEHLDTDFQDYASIREIETGMEKLIPGNKAFYKELVTLLDALPLKEVHENYPHLEQLKTDLEKAVAGLDGKKRQAAVDKFVNNLTKENQIRKEELPEPKQIVLSSSFPAQEAILREQVLPSGLFLRDAERLIDDKSTKKRTTVVKKLTSGTAAVERAIARLKGLSRVWGTVEPIRDFAAGVANFFAAFGQDDKGYLTFSALFNQKNILSPKNININEALKSKRFEQLFNQLHWNSPQELKNILGDFAKKWNKAFPAKEISKETLVKLADELAKLQESRKSTGGQVDIKDIKAAIEKLIGGTLSSKEDEFLASTLYFEVGIPAKIRQLITSLLKDITVVNTIKDKELLRKKLRDVIKADIKKILLLMNGMETAGLFKVRGTTNISPIKPWNIERDNNCAFNSFAFGLMQLAREGKLDHEKVRTELKLTPEEWAEMLKLTEEALKDPAKSTQLQQKLAPRLREMAIESFDKRRLETTIREDLLATFEHQALRALAARAQEVIGKEAVEKMAAGAKEMAEQLRLECKDTQALRKRCDEVIKKSQAKVRERYEEVMSKHLLSLKWMAAHMYYKGLGMDPGAIPAFVKGLSAQGLEEAVSGAPKFYRDGIEKSRAEMAKNCDYELFILQYLLEKELGFIPLQGDLFNDSTSEVAQQIAQEAAAFVKQFDADTISPDKLLVLKKLELGDWYDRKGKDAYLHNLKQNGIWGGPAELNGLAKRFGIQLLMFGQRSIDEGADTWGSFKAVISDPSPSAMVIDDDAFTMKEIALLRTADLIAGAPVTLDEPNTVFFRLASEADIREKLKGHDALIAKFLKVYKAGYREPEVFLGLRNTGVHWETISTTENSFNLSNLFKAGKLKNKYIADYFNIRTSGGTSSLWGSLGGSWYGDFSGASSGARIPISYTGIRQWEIERDNNCTFNAFGFSLMQLALEKPELAANMQAVLKLEDKTWTELIGLAKKAKDNHAAAVKLQHLLAPLLRDMAIKNMDEGVLLGGILNDLKATYDSMVFRAVNQTFLETNAKHREVFKQLAKEIAANVRATSRDAADREKKVNTALTTMKDMTAHFLKMFDLRPENLDEPATKILFNQFHMALFYDVKQQLGMIGLVGDLFNDSQSPVKKKLDEAVQASVKAFGAGGKSLDAIIREGTTALDLWFNGSGKGEYLKFLGKNKIWGGSAELNTLAGLFNIKILQFGPYNMDEGVGYGEVEVFCDPSPSDEVRLNPFATKELQQLMAAELIEGKPIEKDKKNRLFFRLVSEDQVRARLKEHPELLAKFLPLYQANFRMPTALISVRNESGGHWEAVSSPDGHFDLLGDFIRGKITRKPVESGAPAKSGSPDVSGKKGVDAITKGAFSQLTGWGVTVINTDLTKLDGHALPGIDSSSDVIAVVNAANSSLLGGGGIDGVIHGIANKGSHVKNLGALAVEEAGKQLGKTTCGEGEAVITDSLGFASQNIDRIIHTVGPNWSSSAPSTPKDEAESLDRLSNCYYNSLVRAAKTGVTAVVFCSVSTSIFAVPKEKAIPAQLRGIETFFTKHPEMKGKIKIYMNGFEPSADGTLEKMYQKALDNS